jgi:hypothetical protein
MAVMLALFAALTALNFLGTASEVNGNNRQWCDTLTLLTSKPVPKPADPSANPSRMEGYTLYEDFAVLRRRFGC